MPAPKSKKTTPVWCTSCDWAGRRKPSLRKPCPKCGKACTRRKGRSRVAKKADEPKAKPSENLPPPALSPMIAVEDPERWIPKREDDCRTERLKRRLVLSALRGGDGRMTDRLFAVLLNIAENGKSEKNQRLAAREALSEVRALATGKDEVGGGGGGADPLEGRTLEELLGLAVTRRASQWGEPKANGKKKRGKPKSNGKK